MHLKANIIIFNPFTFLCRDVQFLLLLLLLILLTPSNIHLYITEIFGNRLKAVAILTG
jgi:hypothetical protein